MKGISKNWPILLFEFFIVFSAGFLICNSEYFQSLIAPERFWENKIQCLERNLKQIKWHVRELELSLEHQRASEKYLVQQAVDHANTFGNNPCGIAMQVREDHGKRLDEIESELEISRCSLITREKELNYVLTKLHKTEDLES